MAFVPEESSESTNPANERTAESCAQSSAGAILKSQCPISQTAWCWLSRTRAEDVQRKDARLQSRNGLSVQMPVFRGTQFGGHGKTN